MTNWNAGYVTEIGYTYGYYTELNPLRTRLAFLRNGIAVPKFVNACELGFGQGLSINIHAAASSTQWFGNDFNPSHTGFAQELASAAGTNAKVFDDGFAEFCQRRDLPDFDFIGTHGVWSWVSETARTQIVDFVRRKLKVGGVFYMGYNTYPGWASFAPVRHMLCEHVKALGSHRNGLVGQIDDALIFAKQVLESSPYFTAAHPTVGVRFDTMKDLSRHYLAHEYFNEDWQPMHFATAVGLLDEAKLQFAGSAYYPDHVDVINFSAEQQQLLSEIKDPIFQQTVRDLMVNRTFRKDYWVKGLRRHSQIAAAEELQDERVLLTSEPTGLELIVSAAMGKISIKESVYMPIIEQLADGKPKSLGELYGSLAARGDTAPIAHLAEKIMLLVSAGHLTMVQDEAAASEAQQRCDDLNLQLMLLARADDSINFLASPLMGGGVAIGRFEQLFLLARRHGRNKPEEIAQAVLDTLAVQGQLLQQEGKLVESAEERLTLLTQQAATFLEKRLPLLQSLQVR